MIETLASGPLVSAIGLALVDFIWQGAAIGIGAAVVLAGLRRSTADVRYAAACLALAAMCLAPVLTATYYARAAATSSADAIAPPSTTAVDETGASPASPTLPPGEPFAAGVAEPAHSASAFGPDRLAPWLPTIVVLWFGGVAALSLNLLRGWVQIRRLLRQAAPMSASVWPARLRLMADRLGIRQSIRLVKSAHVDVPAVIGWLRPAIVVPMSVISGLSPAHLDAILAHELSHIRRRDYLVNLVQCVVETLLFYHPAVWWVSRRIRLEREHCCDDLAASLCDSRLTYASALASLETLRAQSPALVIPATGGVLLHRIRRLVEPRWSSIPEFSGGFAMCVVATLLLLVGQVTATPPAIAAVDAPDVVQTPATPIAPVPEPAPALLGQAGAPVQPDRGTISGTVRDAHGGVIPGATVRATAATSALSRSVFTNARGQFVLADLGAGEYDVVVSISGFKTWQARVQLLRGQPRSLDVRLEVGGLTETVVLHGNAASPPPPAVPIASRMQGSAAALFDAAKARYQQGQFAEAERLTEQALALVRAAMRENPPGTDPSVTPAGPTPIRVGGSIREPRKVRHVNPIYPQDAWAAGVGGYVIIEAVVATDGSIRDAKVLGGEPMLQQAALDAVQQWQYTPTLLNGVPVEIVMNVTVHFKVGGA